MRLGLLISDFLSPQKSYFNRNFSRIFLLILWPMKIEILFYEMKDEI